METYQNRIALLLSQTLSPDANIVHAATDSLDALSTVPDFSLYLLFVAADGENQGVKVAAATYLKNFTRRNIDREDAGSSMVVGKHFKDALLDALLKAEPPVLKVLIETFRAILAVEFVKKNSWPELVSHLLTVIRGSDLMDGSGNSEWKTVNTLTVLHSLIRPFQYFLNPKVVKEPVPVQLELISQEILVPLFAFFHHIVKKAISAPATWELETEKIILIICKCIYFAVRSHMPSALPSSLPSLCDDLFGILNSLNFDVGATSDGQLLRLKTGKRSLLIFCALVTRHRKFSDKLMPNIVGCVSKIVKHSVALSKLDFLSERIISLSFDVLSRVLETGPGWRLVSPYFSNLLETAIFPALALNEKDMVEWEEDPDEYLRKNLPTELEEISGWREDLFTARKSALNLLGVIAISKGPPIATSSVSSKRKKGKKNRRKDCRSMGELLVLPFLSKFPIPTNASTPTVNEYYGVLMAYSSLTEFVKEQASGFTATLIQNRLLPLYRAPYFQPYLVASANWFLGELASCIPEELSADVYSYLMEALSMPDMGHVSCYPVRMSAAGAIAQLLENECMPVEWLPLLQLVVGRVSNEEDSAVMFQLLGKLVEAGNENITPHIPVIVSSLVETISKCIPPKPEPWPQMVESGFATLAVMVHCWEEVSKNSELNEFCEIQASCKKSLKESFSELLKCAWLSQPQETDDDAVIFTPSPSSVDDSSTLLRFILQNIETNEIPSLRISELLLVWSDLIADWHAWEEAEDLSIFSCIREVISLNSKYSLKYFFVGEMPSPPAPPVPRRSVIEGISSFIAEAFSQYPSAVWRSSLCVHMLLHIPCHTYEVEEFKQSVVSIFSEAVFSRFKEIRSKPSSLWKPLLLALSSCYLCFPDIVGKTLLKIELDGISLFASALSFILTSKIQHNLSENKLAALALTKMVEELQSHGKQDFALLKQCLTSLMEGVLKLRDMQREEEEAQEEIEDGVSDDDDDDDTEDDDDDDEDSEEDEHEETEEEFWERYAEAATALDIGDLVEEGDIDDQDQEIELGVLEKVDVQRSVLSVIEKYHQILKQGDPLPPEMISGFLNVFPECSKYFH